MKNKTAKAVLIMICMLLCSSVLFGCVDEPTNPPECIEHSFGDWEEVVDPSETHECQDKEYERTCSACGEKEEKHGSDHIWEEKIVESTCITEGSLISVCSVCEKSEVKEVLPLGDHVWEEKIVESTCITEGSLISVCSVCEKSEVKEALPLVDHVWEYITTTSTSCKYDDVEIYKCTVCEEYKHIYFPSTFEHSFEGYDFDAETHYQVCTVCDKKLNIDSHNYNNHQCTVCGVYDEYYEITMCIINGYSISDIVFAEQVKEFADSNHVTIKLNISKVPSSRIIDNIINDPSSAPDIFCFTQKELQGLIDADAIISLDSETGEKIKADHCQGAILAASENGIVYGYPLTVLDSTAIMFYDKSLINDNDAKSLEKIIEICEENNKYLRFSVSNGWGASHFFMGTGCKSNWNVNKNWEIVSLDDTYNSEQGIVAMKGLAMLVNSPAFNNEAYFIENNDDTAVIISELSSNRWVAERLFGDNLGVAPLPYFSVDGESYQMGSYSDSIMLGISPTEDTKKAELLSRLALWLSDEKCQTERYDRMNWCPTNLAAQASDRIQSDVYFSAQIEQYNVSTPERFINLDWWRLAENLYIAAKEAKTDDDFQLALDQYTEALSKIFNKETKPNTWSVIGGFAGSEWEIDFPMTEISEGVWESEAIYFEVGQEYKCRLNNNWDVNYGALGTTNNDPNCVANETGTYVVRLILHSDGKATIELVPQC